MRVNLNLLLLINGRLEYEAKCETYTGAVEVAGRTP